MLHDTDETESGREQPFLVFRLQQFLILFPTTCQSFWPPPSWKREHGDWRKQHKCRRHQQANTPQQKRLDFCFVWRIIFSSGVVVQPSASRTKNEKPSNVIRSSLRRNIHNRNQQSTHLSFDPAEEFYSSFFIYYQCGSFHSSCVFCPNFRHAAHVPVAAFCFAKMDFLFTITSLMTLYVPSESQREGQHTTAYCIHVQVPATLKKNKNSFSLSRKWRYEVVLQHTHSAKKIFRPCRGFLMSVENKKLPYHLIGFSLSLSERSQKRPASFAMKVNVLHPESTKEYIGRRRRERLLIEAKASTTTTSHLIALWGLLVFFAYISFSLSRRGPRLIQHLWPTT